MSYETERLSRMEIIRRTKIVVDYLSTHLPEGILDCELQSGFSTIGVRVDSVDNVALDPFIKYLDRELNTFGLKLGKHIRLGFNDEEQSDGWHIEEM